MGYQHLWKILLFLLSCTLLTAAEQKSEEEYRVYDDTTPEHVKEFYRLNHAYQTLDFVLQKKREYLPLKKGKMGIWDAIHFLDQIADESDPDLDLPQSYHCYQTAETLRNDGAPRWLVLVGFIHDLGKILTIYGEPQWAVVGDTYPLGCAWSDQVVFSEYFKDNPDTYIPAYQTLYGIYSLHCGLDQVHMSWGHDEYLYQVVKDYLPAEGAYIIRYHSFYALHRNKAYEHLLDEKDQKLLSWLQYFSHYDLYSKSPEKLDIEKLRPFYEELVAEFFPSEINW